MINILIADDDALIRDGLQMLLESQSDFNITGIAKNGKEAVSLCRNQKNDVALLDIRMPEMDGIEAAEFMINESLCSPLLLTTFDEEDFIIKALKLGVSGYILKNSPAEMIFSAIRTVSAGGTVFQEDILKYVRERVGSEGADSVFSLLSARETDIVRLIAKGLSNQEIADSLYISNGTVRNYISVILEKTGLEHRTQIAVKYLTK
ncbi:response regulator transcription factor [Ruminococcus sp. Marseille-P6503]|uniref:response regulator transcription factor n=1 Tax=Ruminococcus sp. Marseille-P6503 TaxID=2364796 RepID=UPI001FAB3432|nr:response regulator transcription factor [Ruminococcus sp. Marseille-P6503]